MSVSLAVMAKIVDQMPPRKRGRTFMYPWDEWLNGQVWELTQGVDFEPPAFSFATHALKMVQQRRLSLRVSRRKNVVWIGPDGNSAG